MSRSPTGENDAMRERKRKSLLRLKERYYGKKDLLETIDAMPEKVDQKYRNDLKRRLQSYKNDLTYRGAL